MAHKLYTMKFSQSDMVIMFKYCQGNVAKIADLYWVVKESEKLFSDFSYWLLSEIMVVNFWVSLLDYLKQKKNLMLFEVSAIEIINILGGK